MLTHPTGLFSGDYISALRGALSLKFLHSHTTPKLYFQFSSGRRAASRCALPRIVIIVIIIIFFNPRYIIPMELKT